jgi:hypothetical protein
MFKNEHAGHVHYGYRTGEDNRPLAYRDFLAVISAQLMTAAL